MKRCLSCGYCHMECNFICPQCESSVPKIGSFFSFAPHLAKQNDGFEASLFGDLYQLEDGHFWFRNRNRLIQWAIRKFFTDAQGMLEIGCGSGYVLSGVRDAFPGLSVAGSEIYVQGLQLAAQRIPEADLLQMDARQIPFVEEFDLIGAFDVLEHIEEDETVLAQMSQALKPNGGILLTVPQHPFLWSQADEYACHVRRYTAEELRSKMLRAGFDILHMTSFVSFLFPLMALSRLTSRKRAQYQPMDEFKIHPLLNRLFEQVLTVEQALLRQGCSLPFGGSLLAAARKKP